MMAYFCILLRHYVLSQLVIFPSLSLSLSRCTISQKNSPRKQIVDNLAPTFCMSIVPWSLHIVRLLFFSSFLWCSFHLYWYWHNKNNLFCIPKFLYFASISSYNHHSICPGELSYRLVKIKFTRSKFGQ